MCSFSALCCAIRSGYFCKEGNHAIKLWKALEAFCEMSYYFNFYSLMPAYSNLFPPPPDEFTDFVQNTTVFERILRI